MQGYNSKDLARAFRTVRKNTIQVAEEIPEDKYSYRAGEGSRTVAETLAHIAVAPRFHQREHGAGRTQMTMEIFMTAFQRTQKEEAELKTKAEIIAALNKDGEEFASWLETVSDESLSQLVHFPPEVQQPPKTRFEMLLGVKEHEMHHRAQLMVAERLLGITPHLTRQRQERMAEMQKAQAAKG